MDAETPLSSQFLSQARHERDGLIARIGELRGRAGDLRASADALESESKSLEIIVREIEDLLGLAPQLRLEIPGQRLGGRELRDIAVQVLRRQGLNDPVHYREWFDWVVDEGYRVGGKDPIATFLAQVSQDERVERIGNKSGRYRLRSMVS